MEGAFVFGLMLLCLCATHLIERALERWSMRRDEERRRISMFLRSSWL